MASLNKVCLIGNVGRDPELRTMPSGDQMANVALATTESWKDKSSGEKKELTEWHRLVFTGKLAEIVGQYVRKRTSLYIEGRLKTRKYTDAGGIERFSTEINVDMMQMLGGRDNAEPTQAPAQAPAHRAPAARTGPGYQPSPTSRPVPNAFEDEPVY